MAYHLWDQETANLVGTYPTQEAALRAVAEIARIHGAASDEARFLGLSKGLQAMAGGEELLRLAREPRADRAA